MKDNTKLLIGAKATKAVLFFKRPFTENLEWYLDMNDYQYNRERVRCIRDRDRVLAEIADKVEKLMRYDRMKPERRTGRDAYRMMVLDAEVNRLGEQLKQLEARLAK